VLPGLHDQRVVVHPRIEGVEVTIAERDGMLSWAATNGTGDVVTVRSVAIVGRLGPVGSDPRMLVNGYQSWSPTGVRRIGVDRDPSSGSTIEAVRGAYHADHEPTEVLRSELITVIDLDTGAPRVCIGFVGATDHDGTIRVERDGEELRVTIEAWLGEIDLAPGEHRKLNPVRVERGDDPSSLLERWAREIAAAQRARTAGPYRVGWCSWYQYFHEISERALRDNLARAGDWPFDIFQVDDGYQRAIGDWLETSARFPSDLAGIASAIRATGLVPGIWVAPFLAHLDSEVGRTHPDWFATDPGGEPLVGMVNDHWGGFVHTLDTSMPEVLAHLESTARALVDAGFEFLKLDFTYAPALPGRFRDRSFTPAQRVRAGFEAFRHGAGDDTFLLGCGAPLGACIGLVDGMRIGPDVAPRWDPEPGGLGYDDCMPAVANAWRSTLVRSFMHRRLWVNDPDCVMLRTDATELAPSAARSWALAVGMSGGLPAVSDDLALLGPDARSLLDDVVALGRASDEAAIAGASPRCADLMEHAVPTRLASAGRELLGDPGTRTARLV
jgi:alpha-galactosidase